MTTIQHLKYPIGNFEAKASYSKTELAENLTSIETFPMRLNQTVCHLSPRILDKPYRPDGWTRRQVIHHLADSHLNGLIRTKLALTENSPVIKPYREDQFAMLADYNLPVEASLKIIEGVHLHWAELVRNLIEGDYSRTYIHPEYNRNYRIDQVIALYAWHGNHHLKHLLSDYGL